MRVQLGGFGPRSLDPCSQLETSERGLLTDVHIGEILSDGIGPVFTVTRHAARHNVPRTEDSNPATERATGLCVVKGLALRILGLGNLTCTGISGHLKRGWSEEFIEISS